MGWMQFVQSGMQMAGGLYDAAADQKDAALQKRIGLATANANEERIRRDSATALGVQRASAAQSGFDSSSGSFAALQGQSAGALELDALTERYKGELNAWQMDERANRARDKQNFMLDPLGHFGQNRKASSWLFGGGIGALTNSKTADPFFGKRGYGG